MAAAPAPFSLTHRLFGGGVELPPERGSLASSGTDVPLLLILHGLYGDADNWQTQAKALSDRALVLVPDLPNHGRSPWVNLAAYDQVAALLWSWLDDWLEQGAEGAEARPLYLLGHSMGGKLAMAMAFARPHQIAGLVVVDIGPRAYRPRHARILAGLLAVQTAGVATRTAAESILAEYVAAKDVRLFLMKSFIPDAAGGRWHMNAEFLAAHEADLVGWPFDPTASHRFDGPTLVLYGERSDYLQAADEELVRRYLPQAQLRMVPDAGHWLHAEQREQFLAMVRIFLP